LAAEHSAHDTVTPDFDTKLKMKDAQRAKDQHFPSNDPAESLITFGIAPNEPEAWPLDAFIDEIKFARAISARVITAHVAMGHYDLNKQVVQQLGEANLLKRDLLFSHGSAFTDQEIDLCSTHKCGVVSTPETDLQMGMGFPVAFRAADGGCNVGLGLDISSNQNNDMFVQMRLLLQAERARADAAAPSVNLSIVRKSEEALYFATLGGAKAIGMDHLVGSITPGKRADLVITRCDDINMVPTIDPVGILLFNAVHSNIDTVMIDGVVLKRDAKLVDGVWENIRGDVRERSARIVRIARDVAGEIANKMTIESFGKTKI
jgi:cytosine/adenosine deaminase-related metal-dependent hydrolase